MTSMIDDVLKQYQRFEDIVGGGAAMREILRQTGSAQTLYHQFGLSSSFAGNFYDAHLGSTTVRDFIKHMEGTSAAARLVAGYDHGTSEAVRALGAGYDYDVPAVVRSLTQWQELVGSTALANVLMSIDKSALCFARQTDEWSGALTLAKELDKTRQMMLQPEWEFLTGSTARAAQAQLLGLYDTQSVYRQLLKQVEHFASLGATSPDEEAESYFQVIKGYLANAFKGVTHFSPGDWFAIVHLLFGVVMEIHALHVLQAVQGQLSEVNAKVSAMDDREKHTSAVVDSLTAKLDALMEQIAEQKEASQSVKWAARGSLVVVHAQPQSGTKTIGVLLPFQVVTQIDCKGKWIQVGFQDHKSGVARQGWVMKKHLERITPTKFPS